MSPAEFGIVQSMQTLSAIVLIFFTIASERSVFRLFHDYHSEIERKQFVGNISILIFIATTLFYTFILIWHNSFEQVFKSISFYPYYLLALTNALLLTFSLLPNNLFQVKEEALKCTLISFISFFIGVIFILYFLIYKNEKAIGLLKGQMIANGLMLVFYIPNIIKNSFFKIDLRMMKAILSFSLPMLPMLVSSWLLNMSNRIFLDRFITDNTMALKVIGVYSLAYKIASISSVILGAFYTAYSPVFFSKANSIEHDNAKKELETLNFTYSIVCLIVCFFVALFSRELIQFFFNAEYLEAKKIIPIITISFFLSQLSGLFNLMNYQNKKTFIVMWIVLFSAIISVGCNFVLIPKYYAFGAAWSTVIGILINMLLSERYARRGFYVSFHFHKILFLSIFLMLIVFIDQSIFSSLNIWLTFIIKCLIVSILTIFLFVNRTKFLQLFKY